MGILLKNSLENAGSGETAPGVTVRNELLCSVAINDSVQFPLRVARAAAMNGSIALLLPALGVSSRYYERFACRLATGGLTTVTVDLRGQGESLPVPRRGDEHGYMDIVETDLPRIIAEVANQFPGQPIWLVGHSLGGQLALVFGGLNAKIIAGIAVIATGSAWNGGFTGKRRVRNLFLSQLVALISLSTGLWRGDVLGFGGRQSSVLMRDWARQVKTGQYTAHGSKVDYEYGLAQVVTPVLLVDVEGDTLAPPGCVDHLVSKIPRATVERWNYTRVMAASHRLTHFSWARHSPGLAEHVAAWVLSK